MSKLRWVATVVVASSSLGACASSIKVPEIPILDSPALAARREPEAKPPVRYVEVPTPLPLPGQLKPVGKGAEKGKDTRSPSERGRGPTPRRASSRSRMGISMPSKSIPTPKARSTSSMPPSIK